MEHATKENVQVFLQNVGYKHVTRIAIMFLLIGTVFYHLVEKFTWLDSIYFTFVTLATIGYGDFVPHTAAGKIFTMVYALFGITIFIVLAKILLTGVAVRAGQRKQRK